MKSWKTTAMGVLTILGALVVAGKALFDGDPETGVSWDLLSTTIMAGVGLIMARDNDKSSEDVGTK